MVWGWDSSDLIFVLFPRSVQFSCSVMSDSLRAHGLQRARLPSPSSIPGTCSNSRSASQWCHPTISSSVVPFSSCLQSFPASGSFLMSRFFTYGGQSIGASASASVLPMNIQGLFPLGLTGLISLQSKGLSRVFSTTKIAYAVLSSHFFHTHIVWIHSVCSFASTVYNPVDCSPPGSSVNEISQARILEAAISFSIWIHMCALYIHAYIHIYVIWVFINLNNFMGTLVNTWIK